MPISLAALSIPFGDNSIKLIHVAWSDKEPSKIRVKSKRTNRVAVVEFESMAGFRMLSELDLASFWLGSDNEKLRSSWLFKVMAGGWFEQEAKRDDFYTKHQPKIPHEFLITGYEECISVLSFEEPKVYELPDEESV